MSNRLFLSRVLMQQVCPMQCKRPMNRRAKWSDDATWTAVKYCSDKCRKESKRKAPAAPEIP